MSIESWRVAWQMAHLGYRVFPLRDGDKKPRARLVEDRTQDKQGRGSFYVATTEPEQIIFWAERLPHANYGIACGDGLTVFDLDRHSEGQNGLETMGMWCRNFGGCSLDDILKQTFSVKTPSNGLHVYFNGFPGVSRTLVSGVELQNHGRYVVGPGSCTLKGCYTTEDVPREPDQLYKSKSWLRLLVDGSLGVGSGVATSTTKLNIQQCVLKFGCVPEGYRHDAVFMELIYMLGYDDMDQSDVFDRIQELIRESFAGELIFTENELKRNMKNALKHLKIDPEGWLFDR